MKPRIDEYRFGKVIYTDCMDTEYGLPSLEYKSYELMLTDLPYNLDQKEKFSLPHYEGKENLSTVEKQFYEDKMDEEDYKKFCYNWFDISKEKVNGIIFTPGYRNKELWFNKDNFEIIIWHNQYKRGSSKIAFYNCYELLLCYGMFNYRFQRSVLSYNYGYNMVFDYINLIHPHPKPRLLYEWIIKSTKSMSVIDPFLGSGTTAEVCEKLGIKWLGYEINEVYSQDIEKRLKNVKVEPKQSSLKTYLYPSQISRDH